MKGFSIVLFMLVMISCQEKQQEPEAKNNDVVKKAPERQKPKVSSYSYTKGKRWLDSLGTDSSALRIVLAVNRADRSNLARMDSVVIPGDLGGDIAYYLPFPLSVPYLKNVNKIVFFSYPTQAFAAYEHGELIYTGPTSMGRKKDTTPTGLFFTNWKAEQTTSTFNDEWDLRWNFNIENEAGIGWHQYAMPGYPASHSCLRMQEKDARYMYEWADEWILIGKDSVRAKGTPVIVFGQYNFAAPAPWRQLVNNPQALDISPAELEAVASSHLNTIMTEQQNRAAHGKQ